MCACAGACSGPFVVVKQVSSFLFPILLLAQLRNTNCNLQPLILEAIITLWVGACLLPLAAEALLSPRVAARRDRVWFCSSESRRAVGSRRAMGSHSVLSAQSRLTSNVGLAIQNGKCLAVRALVTTIPQRRTPFLSLFPSRSARLANSRQQSGIERSVPVAL